MISIRRFQPSDAPVLWQLFYHTVRQVNRQDYSEVQVNAWANDDRDAQGWAEAIAKINPWVAEANGEIIGYADVQADGYIDHFFCHHQWQGKGVGRALMAKLHQQATDMGCLRLYAQVSMTARAFFEVQGFTLLKEQRVVVRDTELTNFVMEKQLLSS